MYYGLEGSFIDVKVGNPIGITLVSVEEYIIILKSAFSLEYAIRLNVR